MLGVSHDFDTDFISVNDFVVVRSARGVCVSTPFLFIAA